MILRGPLTADTTRPGALPPAPRAAPSSAKAGIATDSTSTDPFAMPLRSHAAMATRNPKRALQALAPRRNRG